MPKWNFISVQFALVSQSRLLGQCWWRRIAILVWTTHHWHCLTARGPHWPAPFVQRRAQQPILVINSHKLYSTEQTHNNITFYMLDFPLQPLELILFGMSKTNLITKISIVVARNLPWFSFTALKTTSCGKLVFIVWLFSFTWNIQPWCQLPEKGGDISKS